MPPATAEAVSIQAVSRCAYSDELIQQFLSRRDNLCGDSAIKDFTTAIELDGRLAQAYKNRGYAYFVLGKIVEAEEDFNRAVTLTPRFRSEIDANLKVMKSWK